LNENFVNHWRNLNEQQRSFYDRPSSITLATDNGAILNPVSTDGSCLTVSRVMDRMDFAPGCFDRQPTERCPLISSSSPKELCWVSTQNSKFKTQNSNPTQLGKVSLVDH
jgi:hypothetical protein